LCPYIDLCAILFCNQRVGVCHLRKCLCCIRMVKNRRKKYECVLSVENAFFAQKPCQELFVFLRLFFLKNYPFPVIYTGYENTVMEKWFPCLMS
jgi:hypothetical protein